MELSLAEQYILLALKDESGKWATGGDEIALVLPGCVLIELTQMEFIKIENKKVLVEKNESTGDPVLDTALTLISESKKTKSAKSWVEKFSTKLKGLKEEYLQRLQDKGILRLEKGKILWVFNTKKYPTDNPVPEMKIRQKIRDIVLAGSTPDPEMAALISLVYVTNLLNEVFSKEERKEAKKRMKDIYKNTSSIQPVVEMVQEIQIAIGVVLAAAAITTTGGGS